MRTVFALCLASICLAACPGPAPGGEPDGGGYAELSECFAGDWAMNTGSGDPESLREGAWGSMTLTADLESSLLHISGVCPDGSGSISIPGNGTGASGPVDVACQLQRPNGQSLAVHVRVAAVIFAAPAFLIVQLKGDAMTDAGPTTELILVVGTRLTESHAPACH